MNQHGSRTNTIFWGLTLATAVGLGIGCAGRPSLLPNMDPELRKSSTYFSADAAKRHYEADAPQEGAAVAEASLEYSLGRVDLANLSNEPWTNVEVWINKKYVVFVPTLPSKLVRQLNFQMFYDDQGNYYVTGPTNDKHYVDTLDIFRDGKMYSVKTTLAD